MSFKDLIDQVLGEEKKPEIQSEGSVVEDSNQATAPVILAPEDDLELPVIPDEDAPPKAEDPFRQMIDEALILEGLDPDRVARKKYDPINGDIQTHEWDMDREALYANDDYRFRCKRCLKVIEVKREQTIAEAMKHYEVEPNCAEVVISGIMKS